MLFLRDIEAMDKLVNGPLPYYEMSGAQGSGKHPETPRRPEARPAAERGTVCLTASQFGAAPAAGGSPATSDILTRDGSDGKMPPGYYNPIKYRGFTIYYDPPPIPGWRNVAWHFVHEDYDAEIFSDGSVNADPRAGDGPSWQDCMDQIDTMEGGE